MDVRWDDATMGVEDMANEGVRRAYRHPDNKLRASVLADPAGRRRNTGDNTPGVVNVKVVPGNTVDVIVAAKGGGSEAKSKFAMLNPSDSIVDWVLKTVPTMRSEEHTSELQSLMRISYAVFCLKNKKSTQTHRQHST